MLSWSRCSVASSSPPLPAQPDEHWMAKALDLAQQGVGLASPNPAVGCVIVRQGQLVGAGFHQYDQRDHAEIVALREAGRRARGATAYVTLEPCSHHGRTGPCADALIAAKVARVVIATADANPTVHGRGIERLRHAGVDVITGVLEHSAQRLNAAFAKFIRTGLPYVTLKAAMTLDGRIAPADADRRPGEISWITGPESRQEVHRLRHSVDAVLTGIGTVLADDPLLTGRSGLPRRRPLLRVILDSRLRLPLDSKLVQTAAGSSNDLLVFCTEIHEGRQQALAAAGVSVQQLPPHPSSPLLAVLQHLAQLKIASLLIEAGSRVNASFLNAALVDRLFLFYSPRFLGPGAQPLLAAPLLQQPQIHAYELHRYGPDFAVEARLNDPWQVQAPATIS